MRRNRTAPPDRVDKSAVLRIGSLYHTNPQSKAAGFARLHLEPVRLRLGPMIEVGLIGTCGIIELEVRYSARNHPEYEAVANDRRLGYEWFPMPDEIWDRALEVQHNLSARGELRAVKFPDLLIAATAERHELAVVHYDADYDRIAEITGQAVDWVIPAGSVT